MVGSTCAREAVFADAFEEPSLTKLIGSGRSPDAGVDNCLVRRSRRAVSDASEGSVDLILETCSQSFCKTVDHTPRNAKSRAD
jgi:hypothetical protein